MVNDYLHSEKVIIVCECDNNSGVRLVLTFKRIIQIIPGSGEMNRSQLSFQSKNTSVASTRKHYEALLFSCFMPSDGSRLLRHKCERMS